MSAPPPLGDSHLSLNSTTNRESRTGVLSPLLEMRGTAGSSESNSTPPDTATQARDSVAVRIHSTSPQTGPMSDSSAAVNADIAASTSLPGIPDLSPDPPSKPLKQPREPSPPPGSSGAPRTLASKPLLLSQPTGLGVKLARERRASKQQALAAASGTGTSKAASSARTRAQIRVIRNMQDGFGGNNGNADGGALRFGIGPKGEKLSFPAAVAAWVRRRWVLNPKGSYRWHWNLMIFFILIFFIIEIPLRLGFLIDNCNDCATTIIHLMCDILFCIDCLALQTRTSFYVDELNLTLLELNPRKILVRYLKGWFVFDLVTSLPVHHVLVRLYDVSNPDYILVSFIVQLSYLLRMCKVFRFMALLQYYHGVELRAGTLSADLLKVLKFIFGFFVIAHMSACMWMFIAIKERIDDSISVDHSTWNTRSWPGALGYTTAPNLTEIFKDTSVSDLFSATGVRAAQIFDVQAQVRASLEVDLLTVDLSYLMALYWAVSTMTTVGYGDIVPRNDYEMAYACIVIFIGAVTFGYIISNVSSIIQIEDDTDTKIRGKITAINAYMGYRKLPPDLQKKIRNHYEYTWKRKTVYDEREILQALPTSLRTRVALFLNQDLIRSVAFLRDLGSDCLALLVTELRPFRVGAGYWIFKQGSLGKEMCFVAEGVVEVLGKKNKQLTVLTRGSYFGEFAILAERPTKRSASVRALATTDLFALTKASFDEVLKVYPELKEEVQAHAEARLAEAMAGKEERDYSVLPAVPTTTITTPLLFPGLPQQQLLQQPPSPQAPPQTTPQQSLPAFSSSATLLVPPASPMARPDAAPGSASLMSPHMLAPPSSARGSRRSFSGMQRGSFMLQTPHANRRASAMGGRHERSDSVSVIPRGVVTTLGFNPYLSLPSTHTDGSNEVELRRTVLRGKEELELIMHPELAEEIAADREEQEAVLDAQIEAEKEFVMITNEVAAAVAAADSVAALGGGAIVPPSPQAASTVHGHNAGGGGSFSFAPRLAPSQPSFTSLNTAPAAAAAAPAPTTAARHSLVHLPSQSSFERSGTFTLSAAAAAPPTGGSSSPGVVGADHAFMQQLAASIAQAVQPLQHAQSNLQQMQRSAAQQQSDLDALVAELDQ